MELPPQNKMRQLRLVSDGGLKHQLLTPDGRDILPDLQASEIRVTIKTNNLTTLDIKIEFVQVEAVLPFPETTP